MNVLGGVPGMLNPGEAGANAVNDAAGVTDNIANLIRAAGGRGPQPAPPVAVPQGAARSGERTVGMARNALLDTQPTNAGERFAYFLGGAAPSRRHAGRGGSEGALAREVVVGDGGRGRDGLVVPECARPYVTSAARGSPQAPAGGGIVGGAASARCTPGGLPTGIDPANPLRPVDAAARPLNTPAANFDALPRPSSTWKRGDDGGASGTRFNALAPWRQSGNHHGRIWVGGRSDRAPRRPIRAFRTILGQRARASRRSSGET